MKIMHNSSYLFYNMLAYKIVPILWITMSVDIQHISQAPSLTGKSGTHPCSPV